MKNAVSGCTCQAARVTTVPRTRGRQRAADFLAIILGFLAGTWTYRDDDLWQRIAVTAVVVLVASVLLRLVLRVPLWRTEPDETPPNVPPYGERPGE